MAEEVDGIDAAVTADIPDVGPALSQTPVKEKEETPEVVEMDEQKVSLADITDDNVALASAVPESEETEKISVWWLLIIALLGATGKKMYDDYKEKQANKTTGTDK